MELLPHVETLDSVDPRHHQYYTKTNIGYRIDTAAGIEAKLEAANVSKLAARESELQTQVTSLRADRDRVALESAAVALAAQLAGEHAPLLMPFITERLEIHEAGGGIAWKLKTCRPWIIWPRNFAAIRSSRESSSARRRPSKRTMPHGWRQPWA